MIFYICQYDPADHPPRQGGDTDADATVIDALPYLWGTTVGYTMTMMKEILTQAVLRQMLSTASPLQWILLLLCIHVVRVTV